MDETTLTLLTDLHLPHRRQGPGSPDAFAQALQLSQLDRQAPLSIADIGCGTGAATLSLLAKTSATITAVDLLPAFLERLTQQASTAGYADRLTTVAADMADLPFSPEQFDALWAEGPSTTSAFNAVSMSGVSFSSQEVCSSPLRSPGFNPMCQKN